MMQHFENKKFNQHSHMTTYKKSATYFFPNSFVRGGPAFFFILFMLILFFAVSSADAAQQLTGLRQGRVLIQSNGVSDNLTIQYAPIYGWNEPLLLLGPDGRLMRKELLGHDGIGKLSVKLDQGPGLYELILKPSYMWRISLSDGKMVYAPPRETTGLRMAFKDSELFFQVPDQTASFKLHWINRRGYRGQAARIQVFNPKNELVADHELSKVDSETACRMLGLEPSECSGGAFSPKEDPFPPQEILIDHPIPGIWKIYIGTTPPFFSDDVGVWLSGIPSFFAQDADFLFIPPDEKSPVSAEINILDNQLPKPLLGVVGPFGPPGGAQEKILTDYGVQAEKVFINHDSEEPENDNMDPYHAEITAFNFSRHDNKLWPRPGRFSTIVFNRWADWLEPMPIENRIPEWSEWAQVAAAYAMQERRMNPDDMAVQFFNEPNLELKRDDYIELLKSAGTRIKNDQRSMDCPIAAPAISTALSKYDPDTQNFIDKRWIQEVLKEADDIVDVVVFNVYGARELEDTFLYTTTIDQVDQIIRETNPDGIIEPIIIGATNREGGLAPTNLFNEWEGGLWWASVLSQVVNTGRVKVINYFSVIDVGIRQKGLFTADRHPKSQAIIQQLFAKTLQEGELYRTISDHQGLEAVSVKNGKKIFMILINKSRFPLTANLRCSLGDIEQIDKMETYQGVESFEQVVPNGRSFVELPSLTVSWLEFNLK